MLPGLAADSFFLPDLPQLQLLAQYHKIQQSGVAPTATALTGATVGSLTTEDPLPGSVAALVCPNTSFPTPAPTAGPRAPRTSSTPSAVNLNYQDYDSARAPTFEELDRNSDGCITFSDVIADLWRAFDTVTTIDLPRERGYSAYRISRYDSCIDPSDAAPYGVTAANFSSMDLNGDGCIPPINSSQPNNEFYAMEDFVKKALFAHHDLNSSGCIDRGREFEGAFSNKFSYVDRSRDGRVDEGEAVEHWRQFCFEGMPPPEASATPAFCDPRLQR